MPYTIIGYTPSETDDNSGIDPGAQGALQEVAVYHTDSEDEAIAIVGAGGFMTNDDPPLHIIATGYTEGLFDLGTVVPGSNPGMLLTTSESDLPDNSSATVTSDGRVRTDPTKNELTETDVKRIAASEAAIPNKRTIIDTDGGL